MRTAIRGTAKQYVRTADSGGHATFHICPECGATVHCTIAGREDSVAVPVGAFADPAFPAPTFSVYEERMRRWVRLPDGIEHMD